MPKHGANGDPENKVLSEFCAEGCGKATFLD
jgi:hypothetical protein